MRKIIVRTTASRGEEPDVRFFNTRSVGVQLGSRSVALPVDRRVLRSRYGDDSAEPTAVVPRAAWTIRLRDL